MGWSTGCGRPRGQRSAGPSRAGRLAIKKPKELLELLAPVLPEGDPIMDGGQYGWPLLPFLPLPGAWGCNFRYALTIWGRGAT